MKKIDPIALGATLFIPALHKDVLEVVEGRKYPKLKSVVLDTEDALLEEELEDALQILEHLIKNFTHSNIFVFLRPRNVEVLQKILEFEGIEKIEGFVLPKFSLENAKEYLKLLGCSSFSFMPSIEGEELFYPQKLEELCSLLLKYQEQIPLVRFGLEDMLKVLCMRRKCGDNIFDIAATASIVGNFIARFKSAGFSVSGGVYPCFKDRDGFIKDVQRDLKEGLFGKTIIHPNQIEPAHELYKVTQSDFDEAREILRSSKAVFAQNDKMAERTTMLPWATMIVRRGEIYGIT